MTPLGQYNRVQLSEPDLGKVVHFRLYSLPEPMSPGLVVRSLDNTLVAICIDTNPKFTPFPGRLHIEQPWRADNLSPLYCIDDSGPVMIVSFNSYVTSDMTPEERANFIEQIKTRRDEFLKLGYKLPPI